MSEYIDITEDYIYRCLENYIKFNEQTEFNVTLAVSTIQAVSMAFVSQCDNTPCSGESFLNVISSEMSALFENNKLFQTGKNNYQHWNNIRNSFSHMMEENVKILPNNEKEIGEIRFKCNGIKKEQMIPVESFHKFLVELYKIVVSYKKSKYPKC